MEDAGLAALIARFRPTGMARAPAATAGVRSLVTPVARAGARPIGGPIGA
jgi:hypothetical protein